MFAFEGANEREQVQIVTGADLRPLSSRYKQKSCQRKKPLVLRLKASDLKGRSNRTKPEPFGRELENFIYNYLTHSSPVWDIVFYGFFF